MLQIKRFVSPLFLVLLVVISPLVFSTETVDINYAPQFLFIGAASLLFLILDWIIGHQNRFLVEINPLILSVVAYSLIVLISIFSSQYKLEGVMEVYKLVTWVMLIILLFNLFKENESLFQMVLKLICVSGFILSTIGLLQISKIAFLNIPGNVIPYATLGNRNIFIPAILILLPFITYMIVFFGNKFWRMFSLTTMILIVVVIIWSLMRTAFVAIGIALFVNLTILILLIPNVKLFLKKNKWSKFLATALLVLFTLFLIYILNNVHYPPFQKLISILNFNSAKERAVLWKHSLQMCIEHPLTGVGAGNWKIMLPNYGLSNLPPEARKAAMFYIRPENDFLWVFAETGSIGGLAYLGIFVFSIWACLQKIRKSTNKSDIVFAMALLNALILYVCVAFFGFPKDRSFLHFELALIIAFVLTFCFTPKMKLKAFKIPSLVLILIFGLIVFKGTSLLAAEKKLSQLIEARKNNQHQQVIDLSSSIINKQYLIDQTSTPIHFYEGVAYFSLQNIDKALISFHIAEKMHPYHLHVLNNLATCYSVKGDFNKSIWYLNEALRISPDFQEAIINLSGLHFNNKNYQASFKYFFLAKSDNTNNVLYANLDALISKMVNDSLIKLTFQYLENNEVEKADACLRACRHKNKIPQYHDMQVAVARKRTQLKNNSK